MNPLLGFISKEARTAAVTFFLSYILPRHHEICRLSKEVLTRSAAVALYSSDANHLGVICLSVRKFDMSLSSSHGSPLPTSVRINPPRR